METKIRKITQPLISIITPCYNGEKFVYRFLDSVLSQTYENIELIFINDGSTDKTEEIVLSYESKFKQHNIDLVYISQKNKGQAAALNQGLKIFRGDYLTWPDSDDILHKDNIKNKVDFLECNHEFGLVLCKSRMLNEANLKQIGSLKRTPPIKNDNLFYDLIVEDNVYFAPGGYMARTSAFLDTNPQKQIYESKTGQNWQMLLPVAYKYKCGYLDEFLYDYLVRESSHSRQGKSEEEIIEKSYDHEDTLKTVIKEMNIKDEKYYLEIIDKKYARKRLKIAMQFKNKILLEDLFRILKQNRWLDKYNIIVYLRGKYQMFNVLCNTCIALYNISLLPIRVARRLKRVFYDNN